ncbi:MAG TPA: hypothetical protein VF692_13715 [Pyrinomonadaceae bacterium]|jgi:hypothetical protein
MKNQNRIQLAVIQLQEFIEKEHKPIEEAFTVSQEQAAIIYLDALQWILDQNCELNGIDEILSSKSTSSNRIVIL